VQPLDPITARGGLIAGRTRDGVIEGAVLASPPGHPFWPIVFARLQAPSWSARALRGTFDSAYVLFSTGPQMLRRAMREYLRTLSRQTPPRAAVTICDPATFSSRSWLARYQPFETSTTFVRHHYSDSWLRPGEERLLRWFTLRTLRWGVAILGLTAVLLGWWLS
jgi:mannosyltransferase OCH1-like enzyme